MNRRLAVYVWAFGWACLALAGGETSGATEMQGGDASDTFSFIAAGDMRNFVTGAPAGKRYFDGACGALQSVGAGAFMISPGDVDPPGPVRAALDQYLGTNYLWYPVIGNHEIEKSATMRWFRCWATNGIPHLARRGPPGAEDTTYSFDFGNSHFVVLNEYYNGRSDTVRRGDFPDAAFEWLEKDLAGTRKPLIWVIGHTPIKSLPDMDTGRLRHGNESVSVNAVRLERFVSLLKQHQVRAYLCGHTHGTSVARVQGIWQADSGHVRGAGDKGTPSTFLKFRVAGTRAWVDIYRADGNGEHYGLRKTVELD